MKRTLSNKRMRRTKRSGFRAKLKSKAGRGVLKRRRLKGRKRLGLK